MKQRIRIFLTGGLGNQLFQLASALHFAKGRSIELDLKTCNPRNNSFGKAELLTLNLPKGIKLVDKNEGKVAQKCFGFNLRSGYLPNKYERNRLFILIRNNISSVFFTILLRSFFKVSVSRDLGNDTKIQRYKTNEILIGYFQTYLVAEELLKIKEFIFANVREDVYLRYNTLAKRELPLLVHVRLGDYKNEKQFGVLNSNYYKSIISAQWATGNYRKIWLFSDEPQQAMNRIPENLRRDTRVVEIPNLESAETMRIMTLCSGFIIANSTFSWWAAYFRENKKAHVFAPMPWFRLLPQPSRLYPSEWFKIESEFN